MVDFGNIPLMELNEFLAEWHNDTPRILVHTSGSTGKPKPLMG